MLKKNLLISMGLAFSLTAFVVVGHALAVDDTVDSGATHTELNYGLHGAVDPIFLNYITGWAIDLDGRYIDEQELPIMIFLDGEPLASDIARLNRQDVQDYQMSIGNMDTGAHHGFNVLLTPPQRARDNRFHLLEFYAVKYTDRALIPFAPAQRVFIDADGIITDFRSE